MAALLLATNSSNDNTTLIFSSILGQNFSLSFPMTFSNVDLYREVAKKLNLSFNATAAAGCPGGYESPFQLITKGKNIPFGTSVAEINDFQKIKDTMTTKSIILVVQTFPGGTAIEKQKTALLGTFAVEVMKLGLMQNTLCVVCREIKQSLQFNCKVKNCANTICISCIQKHYETWRYQLQCLICRRFMPNETISTNLNFQIELEAMNECLAGLTCIDYQICNCGQLARNTDLLACKRCINCKRDMCFFCNETWNSQTMSNQLYSCGQETCRFNNIINTCNSPREWTGNSGKNSGDKLKATIPVARCCPKCHVMGAYDGKCKFHRCIWCSMCPVDCPIGLGVDCDTHKYEFCFFCLKPKTQCTKSNDYYTACGEAVKITHKDLPYYFK